MRGCVEHLHDGVVGADGAKLLHKKSGIRAILEGKAAFTRHAVAARVERAAFVVLRLVHAPNVNNTEFQFCLKKNGAGRTAGKSSRASRSGACIAALRCVSRRGTNPRCRWRS